MTWQAWGEALQQNPLQAVDDLLRGAASIAPYERVEPHEFLLAVLPRASRLVQESLLKESRITIAQHPRAHWTQAIDAGLHQWLLAQRNKPLPPSRKLGAYAARVSEALQWPLYFHLPQTLTALQSERAQWQSFFAQLSLSPYRDPTYEHWQVLAAHQSDNSLQFVWYRFVLEAARTCSQRYLMLGLLALARLPLDENDSLRNLRLQVQALVSRYQLRKTAGTVAQEELSEHLQGVLVRNPSMDHKNWHDFLEAMLKPLGEHVSKSVLAGLGLLTARRTPDTGTKRFKAEWRLKAPFDGSDTDRMVQDIKHSYNLQQAWQAMRPLLQAHEDHVYKTGDAYNFVTTLDRCGRALCKKYPLREQEVQNRLFQWIHLSLQLEPNNPRLWMLWQLALEKAGHPQRAIWVLWEMTRRFPDQLPCRVELAQALAETGQTQGRTQAQTLLHEVLRLEPDNLHAYSTLAKLALQEDDWDAALDWSNQGLRVDDGNQACAVLKATALERRNQDGDLAEAIAHLQRFTLKHKGNMNAESYLEKLLRRQNLIAQGKVQAHTDWVEDKVVDRQSVQAESETDIAWQSFAQQVQSWSQTASTRAPTDAALADRVPPLPQALLATVQAENWDAEIWDAYSGAEIAGLNLESALWQYLQRVHNQADLSERRQAQEVLTHAITQEEQSPSYDSQTWPLYLRMHKDDLLNASSDAQALQLGAQWLKALLNRYQPLPTVLTVAGL